jgi:cytochrome c oxidase assembly protein subunit 15
LTPEYQQINKGMSLGQYQEIFLLEWAHRLLARVAGLVFALPFAVLLATRRIPIGEAPAYVGMGLLFVAQAAMGWAMVASGLVARPSVSHYLLAAHLFLALSLIGLSLWTALGHYYGFQGGQLPAPWSAASKATAIALGGLLLQMAYGAFTAGLKAGLVSNTWPLMLGRWIPRGLLAQTDPGWLSLLEAPVTVAFIHRWLAVVVLVIGAVAWRAIRTVPLGRDAQLALGWLVALGILQMGLGIAVVVSGISIGVAMMHQLNAIALYVLLLFLLFRLRGGDTRAALLS